MHQTSRPHVHTLPCKKSLSTSGDHIINTNISSIITVLIAAVFAIPNASADLVRLDTAGTGLSLDNIDVGDIGTAAATVNVIEIPGLTMTVTGLNTGGGPSGAVLNVTATSMGINAAGDGDTDAFEAGFSQSATFRFNQSVTVSQLDFTTFSTGEVFDFAGTSIGFGDLTNTSTDIFDFTVPLSIAANTDFTLSSTAGTIGIEAFDISVASVPEPSTFAMFGLIGLAGLARRRK